MAKYTTTIAVDGTVELGFLHKNRNFPTCEIMLFGHGTWGSGTLTVFWSPNGGTTKIAVTDLTGVAVSATDNFGIRGSFVTGAKNTDQVTLYATLAGSTNPALSVGFYDNN